MKDPWENFAFTWWPSSLGTDQRLPAVPAEPVDEAWRVPWPSMVATASQTPPRPVSRTPTGGGFLSSLDAGRSGGLFGGLATPPAHFESSRYWGVPPASPFTGGVSSATDDPYLSPTPRAPDWDPVPPLVATRPMRPLPDAPSRAPSSASGRLPERVQ